MSRPLKKQKHNNSPRETKSSPPVPERVPVERADQFYRGCLAFNQYFLNVFASVIPADQTAFWDSVYVLLKASGILSTFTATVIRQEVDATTSPGKLFRTNTGCAGLISAVMRKENEEFAVSYVLPLLNDITAFGHPLEVNPKVVDERTRALNEAQLFGLIDRQVDALCAHAGKVTGLMRLVFQQVRECVTQKFGEHIAEIALGGLFFLRYLNPVLLTPNMFIANCRGVASDAQTPSCPRRSGAPSSTSRRSSSC